MKKPNYKEATESYGEIRIYRACNGWKCRLCESAFHESGSLSKALDNNEWYQYAGLCREAMARSLLCVCVCVCVCVFIIINLFT